MLTRRLLTALVVLSVSVSPLSLSACERHGQDGGDDQPAAVQVPAPATPTALGEAIGKTYQDALAEFAGLAKGHPAPAQIADKVSELKARTMVRMLAWGHHRAALSPADRTLVDAASLAALKATDKAHWEAFAAATKHYREVDAELGNTIASLNILPQYAAFEVLAVESPDEAKRLGVE